jgi:hypothetical protein
MSVLLVPASSLLGIATSCPDPAAGSQAGVTGAGRDPAAQLAVEGRRRLRQVAAPPRLPVQRQLQEVRVRGLGLRIGWSSKQSARTAMQAGPTLNIRCRGKRAASAAACSLVQLPDCCCRCESPPCSGWPSAWCSSIAGTPRAAASSAARQQRRSARPAPRWMPDRQRPNWQRLSAEAQAGRIRSACGGPAHGQRTTSGMVSQQPRRSWRVQRPWAFVANLFGRLNGQPASWYMDAAAAMACAAVAVHAGVWVLLPVAAAVEIEV